MSQLKSAEEIVKALAEWSKKYPREQVYSTSRQPQMDGELIEIENAAKEFRLSPVSTDEKWISIEDRLPDNSNYVLFFYKNIAGKNRVSHGFYAAKYSVEADFDQWEGFADYNEEKDEYYVPTGWYEGGWELEFTSSIENVTHWMKKPEPPKTTL